MRVVPCTLVLACMLIGSTGCQLFGKKNNDNSSDSPPVSAKNSEKTKVPPPSTDPLIGGASGVTDLDGILAGRVVDGTGQPVDAQIRWVCTDEPKQADVPIDVAVNGQGYFMIQGLKSGKHYKLTTRAKSGEKTLEVVTVTQAPNVHLLISVNERFAVPEKAKKSAAGAKEQPASAQIPIPSIGLQQPIPATLPPTETYGDRSRIAVDQNAVAIRPPLANIKDSPAASIMVAAPVGQPAFSGTAGAAPIPSSVKIGQRLDNFALYDTSLQPWELRQQRGTKVVLLDFWKTNCPPCLQEISTLRMIQDKFSFQGLQVVGIAYEDAGTIMKQATDVNAVAQQRGANYQLLLGGGLNCPLKRDLDIRVVPTLVLLDENGVVVWRHEGALDRASFADLEFAIKRRLVD